MKQECESVEYAAIELDVVETEVVHLPNIHFISVGELGKRQLKFDKNTKKFEEIHQFGEFETIYYLVMVYVDSKVW